MDTRLYLTHKQRRAGCRSMGARSSLHRRRLLALSAPSSSTLLETSPMPPRRAPPPSSSGDPSLVIGASRPTWSSTASIRAWPSVRRGRSRVAKCSQSATWDQPATRPRRSDALSSSKPRDSSVAVKTARVSTGYERSRAQLASRARVGRAYSTMRTCLPRVTPNHSQVLPRVLCSNKTMDLCKWEPWAVAC